MKDEKIQDLMKMKEEAMESVKKYDTAIKALQDICEHNWGCTGHGHRYNYYECEKCGKTSTY